MKKQKAKKLQRQLTKKKIKKSKKKAFTKEERERQARLEKEALDAERNYMHFKIVKPRVLSKEELEKYEKDLVEVKDFIDNFVEEEEKEEVKEEEAPKEGDEGVEEEEKKEETKPKEAEIIDMGDIPKLQTSGILKK
jgi:hypothetical protein